MQLNHLRNLLSIFDSQTSFISFIQALNLAFLFFNIVRWKSPSVTWNSSSSWNYISQMVITRRCCYILTTCTCVSVCEFGNCISTLTNTLILSTLLFSHLISTAPMIQAPYRISVAAHFVCTLAFSEASTNTSMLCLTTSTYLSSLQSSMHPQWHYINRLSGQNVTYSNSGKHVVVQVNNILQL